MPDARHSLEPGATTEDAGGGATLRLVRLRLALALVAVAIIPIAVILPIVRVASSGGSSNPRTTSDAVAVATRLTETVASIEGRLGDALDAPRAVSTKPLAVSSAARSALAALGADSAVSDVVVADLTGRTVFATKQAPDATPAELKTGLAGDADTLQAVDATSRTEDVSLVTPVVVGGKPVAVVVVRVALDAVAGAAAGADGRVLALIAPDGRPVGTVSAGADPAIGERVLRLAGELGSGSDTTVAVPFATGALAGWSLAMSDAPLPTELPIAALVALAGLTALLVGLAVWMARQVLEPAVALEQSRRRLHDLYEGARNAARVDFLTTLGNHRAFQEELDRQVDAARRYHTPLALVLIDLDEFKSVNDSLGHAVGDDLLAEVGELVRSTTRVADSGFRTGGDEFALILPQTDAAGAEEVARRLLVRCLEERPGGRYRRAISFSAGVTDVAAADGPATRVQLFAQADAALYRSKRAGRTTISRFDPAHDRELIDEHMRADLRARLAAVVEGRKLTAAYQPIFHLAADRLLGVEALVRPRADSGFTGAGGLFEAANVTGQIVELDRAALDVVTTGLEAMPPDLLLTINLSPRSFESPDFSAAALLRILASHRIDPSRVILELTEREQITAVERVSAAVDVCRAAGMRIAADDVGAGNAGLRLLSQIRFDVVKIDLSLIQANARREPVSAVVSSLVDLANRWGALTIAEGIETEAQLEAVRALGVDAAQGFFLGRPGAFEEAIAVRTIPSSPAPVDFAAAVDARRRSERLAV